MINRAIEEFGGEDVVQVLSEEAEEQGGEVEFNGELAVCYDEDGEEVARVGVYGDNQAGGSVASVSFDQTGTYSAALEEATEGIEGVGYDRGQVKQLGPAVL